MFDFKLLEYISALFFAPANFFLACFYQYEFLPTIIELHRDILKFTLAIGFWFSLIGYLLYCVNDQVDNGPLLSFRLINFKNHKFEYLILIFLIIVFYFTVDCRIGILILLICAYIFYYSIGGRSFPKFFKRKDS